MYTVEYLLNGELRFDAVYGTLEAATAFAHFIGDAVIWYKPYPGAWFQEVYVTLPRF